MKKLQESQSGFEYTYSVNAVDENGWNSVISMFRDATVNQAWAYGRVRAKKTSHLIVHRNGKIVAAALIRLIVLPVLKHGIAYISWGPMWRLRNEADDIDVLRHTVRALRAEYVIKRGLFLRISPNMFTNLSNHKIISSIFEEEGFRRKDLNETTFFVDMSHTLEDLRKQLHQKWRNQLNYAEKSNLIVRESIDDKLFDVFKSIYKEMLARKQYPTEVDIEEYAAIQSSLPEPFKLRTVICESKGIPMAGAVFSTCGDTAVYLLGATSREGMKCKASYLVQWSMIKFLKHRGFRTYDLGGCNPNRDKGTYHFKKGICGKNPTLASRIGVMEAWDNPVSLFIVRTGDCLRALRRRVKNRI